MPQIVKTHHQARRPAGRLHRRVRGLDLDKPRPTAAGWALIMLYFGLPAMLIGALIDILIQWTSGHCVGLWCWLIH
ncbi:MAG: hypothetical protein ACKO6R_10435 [Burkholderiaceae bacterium]